MIDRIQWLGHSTFRLQGPPLIYIDPWRVARSAFLADVILISRVDYDHCSPADVNKLCGPDTWVIAGDEAAKCLDGDVRVLRPWQSITIDRARITAVPDGEMAGSGLTGQFRDLSYLISMDYYDIYYAASATVIPEMAHFHPDIAILPVGGDHNGLAGIEEAVEAARILQPRWVIPSHWGTSEGASYLDVRAFQSAVGDLAEVVLLEQVR